MKMGNIVPRAGLKTTSQAFWGSVLIFHHIGSLMSPLHPHLPDYAAACLRGQCRPVPPGYYYFYPPGIVRL